MSDHDLANDPIDRAYVQAEALLDNEAARAARRARVLAAVAQEPAPLAAEPSRRRSPWRRGGWLAAASVAVFCAFLAGRIYQPARDRAPAPVSPASAAPAAASGELSAPPKAPSQQRAADAEPARIASARPASPPTPSGQIQPAAPAARKAQAEPALKALAAAPPPAPPGLATQAMLPAPAPPPPPPVAMAPQMSVGEIAVTGSRMSRRDFAAPRTSLITRSAAAVLPASAAEQAASLRAATTEGRTGEMETLLAQGVPVDAADAAGTTALMKSIEADQPAAATLLRRHGASLEKRNRAGVSVREMAAAKDDPELDQALGLASDGDSSTRSHIGSQ